MTPTAGAVSATIAVADPLVTVDGTSVPCSFSSCVLAAGYADELVRVSTSIGFATPTYTISQTENLVPGSAVQVSVDDVPAGLVFVNLCASGRGCAPSTTTITVSGGSGSAAVPVGPGGWLTTTGQYTTCQESDCYLQLRSYPDFRLPQLREGAGHVRALPAARRRIPCSVCATGSPSPSGAMG